LHVFVCRLINYTFSSSTTFLWQLIKLQILLRIKSTNVITRKVNTGNYSNQLQMTVQEFVDIDKDLQTVQDISDVNIIILIYLFIKHVLFILMSLYKCKMHVSRVESLSFHMITHLIVKLSAICCYMLILDFPLHNL
jgi:hypothetical protein